MKPVNEIIKQVRSLKADHEPEGWPAIQMQDVTALADEVERLRNAGSCQGILDNSGDAVAVTMTRIAQRKLEQMGATVKGVLVQNEAGAPATVDEFGRVRWLDNQPEWVQAGTGTIHSAIEYWQRRADMLADEVERLRGGGNPVAWWDGDTGEAETAFQFSRDRIYRYPVYSQPPSAVPEGWKLVPVEPAKQMVDAAADAYMPLGDMELAIQCANAAAPNPGREGK